MRRRSFLGLLTGSTVGWAVSNRPSAGIGLSATCQTDLEVSRITVVGIGGAGRNLLELVTHDKSCGVARSVFIDTNQRTVLRCRADIGICLDGRAWTDPCAAELAAHEQPSIANALADAGTICILAGLGGRTATCVAPVVAMVARQAGVLTLAVVTTPFAFEGRRKGLALFGLVALMIHSGPDNVIYVSNEDVLGTLPDPVSIRDAHAVANRLVVERVRDIARAGEAAVRVA